MDIGLLLDKKAYDYIQHILGCSRSTISKVLKAITSTLIQILDTTNPHPFRKKASSKWSIMLCLH